MASIENEGDTSELSLIARAVAQRLEEQDLHEVLAFINARTGYRFTGVYAFEPGWVISVALFDSEAPDVRLGANVKMNESYCSLTELGDGYVIEDASCDSRLDGHASRDAVRSYMSVLLRDTNEKPWGTLCHFDSVPHVALPSSLIALERYRPLIEEMFVGGTLARWSPDPARPRLPLA